MQLIDKETAYTELSEYYHHKTFIQHLALSEALDRVPVVDAEPVRHGKWIMKSDPFGFFDEIPVCSECGCTTKLREKTKFCPNCGAKMDL